MTKQFRSIFEGMQSIPVDALEEKLVCNPQDYIHTVGYNKRI